MLFHTYPPVTYDLAYLKSPFDDIIRTASEWLEPQGSAPPILFEANFDRALETLFPMSEWRKLFIECDFGWTAVFTDNEEAPSGPVATLIRRIPCDGVIGLFSPGQPSLSKTLAAVQLWYYEGQAEFPNISRAISVTEGDDGWEFHQSGTPFPFEDAAQYRKRAVKDRFTLEMLVDYLGQLGIDAVNGSRYGPRCALFDVPPDIARGRAMLDRENSDG